MASEIWIEYLKTQYNVSSQVERLLSEGPDGLYLMKNSTEFAGDLTLCLHFAGSVLSYRVRHTQDRRLTVDTDTSFSCVSTEG